MKWFEIALILIFILFSLGLVNAASCSIPGIRVCFDVSLKSDCSTKDDYGCSCWDRVPSGCNKSDRGGTWAYNYSNKGSCTLESWNCSDTVWVDGNYCLSGNVYRDRKSFSSCGGEDECNYGSANAILMEICNFGCLGGVCIACAPSYKNNCDYTNGCGDKRDVMPYNSCDLITNTSCETETALQCDNIDNDCDGEVDEDFILEMEYVPTTWWTTDASFNILESEKNCSQTTDNTNDGWHQPHDICTLGSGLSLYAGWSHGYPKAYLVADPNIASNPFSSISSVEVEFYFEPRDGSAETRLEYGVLKNGSEKNGKIINVTVGGESSPSTLDATGAGWVPNDLIESKLFVVMDDPSRNFDNVNYIKLKVRGDTCFLEDKDWYEDNDGDLYGDPLVTISAPVKPDGYVLDNTDCDDGAFFVNPGAPEVCFNGIDDDCDGEIDEDCYCATCSELESVVDIGDGPISVLDEEITATFPFVCESAGISGLETFEINNVLVRRADLTVVDSVFGLEFDCDKDGTLKTIKINDCYEGSYILEFNLSVDQGTCGTSECTVSKMISVVDCEDTDEHGDPDITISPNNNYSLVDSPYEEWEMDIQTSSIPDSNIFVIILALLIVSIVIVNKKEKNK